VFGVLVVGEGAVVGAGVVGVVPAFGAVAAAV
jgi:hypothetical protein